MKMTILLLIFTIIFNHSYCSDNFIQEIWKTIQNEGIPQQAIETLFIQGIIKGNMDPDCYLNFAMQDAFYLYNAANLWEKACKTIPEPLKQFCNNEAKKYRQFADYFGHDVAKVKQGGIIANQASKSYTAQQEAYVYEKSINILISNYACYKLWPWIASKIKGQAKKENNVYYKWIQDNQSDNGAKRLQTQINKYKADFKQIAYYYVKTLVKHEISFFVSLCKSNKKGQNYKSITQEK